MKNRELYESSKSLTLKSLDFVKKSIDKIIFTSEFEWFKQDSGSFMKQFNKRPFWGILLHDSYDEIAVSEEFNNFSKIVKADDVISSQIDTLVGTYMSSSFFELKNFIFSLIYPFLDDTEIIGFDESLFKIAYSKIESALYSPNIELVRITPLFGFTTDTNDLALDQNLSIVKLSDSEIIELLSLGFKMGHILGSDNFIQSQTHFAIKFSYSLPKIIGEHKREDRVENHNPYINEDLEQAVLNALRLFKEGKVYRLGSLSKSKNIFSPGLRYNFRTPAKAFMRNKVQLDEKEKDKFLNFWKTYQGTNISNKHYLSVAIRRFSLANERESDEDRIIDYMISAEALFLSSGGSFQGELSYRLSHRAAMFIEDGTDEQRNLFKFIRKAYGVRSDIVHGKTPKLPKKEDGSPYSLEEYCQKVGNYLRIALNKTIELASKDKSFSKIFDWDMVIFPKDS